MKIAAFGENYFLDNWCRFDFFLVTTALLEEAEQLLPFPPMIFRVLRIPTTHYSLLTTCCLLLTTHYSQLTTHYLLPTSHYSLPTNDSILHTLCSLLPNDSVLLTNSDDLACAQADESPPDLSIAQSFQWSDQSSTHRSHCT